MFTGIIQGKYPVVEIEEKIGLKSFVIEFPKENIDGLQIGASVAINGACMTVVSIEDQRVRFDVMQESLEKTNLGQVKRNDLVNIERSAKMGDEIGGHVMSGHIIGMAEIIKIEIPENNHVVTFKVASELMKYILDKGFVGLDGASLTIVNPDKKEGTFDVWLIPETLRQTMYSDRRIGDKVNVELDSRTQIIVDTVERVLRDR
jgi:riboflavin synthase